MGTETIKPVQIQNEKLVAIGAEYHEFNPSIKDFTTWMINLDTWDFPETIKDLAYALHKADRIFKVIKTQFKLAEEKRRLKALSENEFKKFQGKFDSANNKAGELFARVKNEYLAWVDKNIPENIKKAWFHSSQAEVNMVSLYNWFKAHTYDLAKAEVVSTKV